MIDCPIGAATGILPPTEVINQAFPPQILLIPTSYLNVLPDALKSSEIS